jgi:hypothetical protein
MVFLGLSTFVDHQSALAILHIIYYCYRRWLKLQSEMKRNGGEKLAIQAWNMIIAKC